MSEEQQEFRGWHQDLIVIFAVVGLATDVPKTEWWAHEYQDLQKERVWESPSQRALDAACLCLRLRYTFFSPLEILLICRQTLLQFLLHPKNVHEEWEKGSGKQCTMLKVVRRFRSSKEFGEDRLILVAATRLNSESGTCTGVVVVHEVFLCSLLDPNSGAERERENIVRGCWGKESRVAFREWWRRWVLLHHIACWRFVFMRPHLLLRDSVWAFRLLCVLSFAFPQPTHAAAAAAHHAEFSSVWECNAVRASEVGLTEGKSFHFAVLRLRQFHVLAWKHRILSIDNTRVQRSKIKHKGQRRRWRACWRTARSCAQFHGCLLARTVRSTQGTHHLCSTAARPQHPLPSRASAPSFYCPVRSSWCCPLRCSTSSYQRGQADLLYLSPQPHFCLFVCVSLSCLSTAPKFWNCLPQFYWAPSFFSVFPVLCGPLSTCSRALSAVRSRERILVCSSFLQCGWEVNDASSSNHLFHLTKSHMWLEPLKILQLSSRGPGVWPFCTLHRLWCSSLVSFTLFSYPQCPHKGASHNIAERGTCGRRSLQ